VAAVHALDKASVPKAAAIVHREDRSAQAIVNLFETSEVLGDYGNASVLPDDTGHLSSGRSQTTLGSGNWPC
jgi:chitosanase